MKIKVIGKFPKLQKEMEKKAKLLGFKLSNSPEAIISYGGDGTFLIAEHKFPGIPKLLIRKSKICNTCFITHPKLALEALAKKRYRIDDKTKIEATFKKYKLTAANDITIINRYPNQALRFEVQIDKSLIRNIIGDGVVISTPFGSGAYFRSITSKTFSSGIGLAFSNPTEPREHIILPDDKIIKVKVTRGFAWLACDNDKKMYKLTTGNTVAIKKSKNSAKIIIPL